MSYLCFLWEVSIAILRTHESIIFQRVHLANKRAFGCTFHLGESISICSAYIAGKPEVFFLSFVWRWRSHSQLLKIRWCIIAFDTSKCFNLANGSADIGPIRVAQFSSVVGTECPTNTIALVGAQRGSNYCTIVSS